MSEPLEDHMSVEVRDVTPKAGAYKAELYACGGGYEMDLSGPERATRLLASFDRDKLREAYNAARAALEEVDDGE